MGVSGTLEYLADLFAKKKKKKQMNTFSVKIRMDCEGCARKVKKVLSGVKGNITYSYIFIFFSNYDGWSNIFYFLNLLSFKIFNYVS